MRRNLLLIAWFTVLAVMFAPDLSDARPFNSDEVRMVELAHDHWGRGPTCPRGITYDLTTRAQLGVYGSAAVLNGRCFMWIAPDPDFPIWINTCTAIAHEWGHLLEGGRLLPDDGHSSVEGDLMSTSPEATRECDRADDRRIYRAKRARCMKKRGKPRKRCIRRARSALTHR